MRVVNRSSHPSAEVERVVRAGWYGRGRWRLRDSWETEPRIVVHRRAGRGDDREGFTPFDRSKSIDLWVEDSSRYPQPGARTWEQELLMSAAHERYHWDHPGDPCRGDSCERAAERQARGVYRRLSRV